MNAYEAYFLELEASASRCTHTLLAQTLPLPEGLAHLSADFKGTEVYMQSRAWYTAQFRLIRETVLVYPGKLRSFNFVIYPHTAFEAPVFATDFLWLGDKLRIGLVDAMPLFAEDQDYLQKWIAPFAALHHEAVQHFKQYDRKLNWSLRYTSAYACLATEVPLSKMAGMVQLWQKYLAHYLRITESLQPITPQKQAVVRAWHQSYNQSHLAVEQERNPFMVYFGEELGRRYNQEFLFSETFGGVYLP